MSSDTKIDGEELTRAAGYVRVSTEEQRRDGWNLEADRSRIEATIIEQNWDRHAIYDDGGQQGDDPDRPGFFQMLAEVDQFDVLIIRDLDRFSRKLAIYASAVDDLVAAGVTLYEFAGDGTGIKRLDLNDEDDRALADVKAVFAQLEKAKIKRRVRQAKDARAKAGGHPGGKRPFGYQYPPRDLDDRPAPLMVDPLEAAVVRRMFEMAQATSQRKIAAILNAEGIPASLGGRWTQSTVARVLGSPLYIGKIRRKVAGEWEWFDGQHDAIIDEDLWRRVNASRATKERRAGGRPMKSNHLLTRGLLRCGLCGSAMQPVASYNGRPEVYKCLGRQSHGPGFCRQPSVHRALIDDALLAQLTSRYFDLDGARDRLRERQATELPNAEAAVAEAEHEVAAAEARIARVTRGWQDDVITDDEYRRQSAALRDELAGAKEAVTQARGFVEQIKAAGATTDAEEALLRLLADLKALVSGTVDEARDVESMRTVIRQLFEQIDLVSPNQPFGPISSPGGGVVIPHDGLPQPAPYWLLPHLRPQMVDWRAFEPIRQPLPEKETTSRYR